MTYEAPFPTGMTSFPFYPPPTIKAGGVLMVVGNRMGVYGPPDPTSGEQELQAEYRLVEDGWRIIIDPIPQLEA